MTPAPGAPARASWRARSSHPAPVIALAVLLLGLTVLFGAQLMQERQRELLRASRALQNLAAVVTEHARQSIETVDAELRVLGDELAALPPGSDGERQAQSLLAKVLDTTPMLVEVYRVDATGRVVAASAPLPRDTPLLETSPAFRHHATTPTSDPFLSEPGPGVVGRADGRQVMRLSRRVSAPSGQFLGMVVADVSVTQMRAIYATVDLGVSGVVTLFRGDGLVLVREPAADRPGGSIATVDFFAREIRDRHAGVFDLPSPLDGVVRLSAFEWDERRRVFVTVGLSRDDVLADWNRRATIGMSAAVLLLTLLAVVMWHRVQSVRDDERTARDAAIRFRRLAAASTDINRAASVEAVLDHVTRAAREIVPAHQARTLLLGAAGSGAAVQSVSLSDRHAAYRTPMPADSGISRLVCERNAALRLTEAELAAHPAADPPGDEHQSRHWPPMRGCLAVPLVARDGSNLGVIELSERSEGEFSDEDEAILEQLARLAASSIEARYLGDATVEALSAAQLARAETERRQQELQQVFSTTSDAFYTVDHDWLLTFINRQAERVLDVEASAVLGRNLWALFPKIVGSIVETEYRRAVSEQVPREFRFFSERLQRWLDVRAFPIEQGLSVYFRDVTEQIALDAQVQQAQKMDAVGQLTGGVAHDFNNLLTIILGSADTLVDELRGDPSLRELAEMTRTAAEKAAQLTQRLLAFSRRQPLAPRVVDVADLVGRLDPLMRRTLGEHIEVHIGRGVGLWKAMVDPSQLETAILNLAINARDAMPDGGRLTIDTTNATLDDSSIEAIAEAVPGDYVVVTVSDTGTGMTPEVAAKAFEPFFTTKDVGRGSGLGLSMVYGFARQSGGHVRLATEPGEGTTFTLYLPRADADQPDALTVDDVEEAPRGTELIVVVEDQELVRRHTQDTLRQLGYSVMAFESGPDAMTALDGGLSPDLLLTDVVLPGGMNGPAIAAAARERLPALRVLYMSGYAQDAVVHHGRLDEGVQLLSKPFRRGDLARKVREVLDGGQP